eukprot:c19236_g1_i1 orf=98-751(+)
MEIMAASLPLVLPNKLTSRHHNPLLPVRKRSFPSRLLALSEFRRVKLNGYASVKCKAYSNDVAVSTPSNTEWSQKVIELEPYRRGCHIITDKIYRAVPEIKAFEVGLANLFVMHTSASLTINENASPDVPLDMEDSLNKIVPEGNHYRHLDEGYDDMPAHVKSSMMGCSLTIPIKGGRFCLGIWQGIWLNEHRNYGGSRRICITIQGVKRSDGRMYT